MGYWASRISFEEDISKLIPSSDDSETISQVLKNVNFADKIILNISSEKENNSAFLQAYADSLKIHLSENQHIENLQIRFEDEKMMDLLDFVSAHLPLYLDDSDYAQLDSLLAPKNVFLSLVRTHDPT